MKISIGIEKRISLNTLEQALLSVLDGTATPEYIRLLAASECTGANRAKKVVAVINRFTVRNSLLPYLKEHENEVRQMLNKKNDRPLLFVAIMCSAYSLFYDTVFLLGRICHAQDQVGRDYIEKMLSEKYGSSRTFYVAFDCVMPMLSEAGFIVRPKTGIYEIGKMEQFSDEALQVYKQSFILNNPMYSIEDDFEGNPYFEFLKR